MSCDGELQEFLNASVRAISRYADTEFDRLARRIEYRLRRIVGIEHRNFWRSYCDEMQLGPSPVRELFEYDIEKMIDFVVAEVPHRQAVLLTIAAMWERQDVQEQDGDLVAPDLIRDEIFDALRQRALNDEQVAFTS